MGSPSALAALLAGDPLDGTKEFIKRNGDFTVNIALIDHGKPILGVVYAPVMNVMYNAADGKAWKRRVRCAQAEFRSAMRALAAGGYQPFHADAELKEYLQQLGNIRPRPSALPLKFCLVAEGQAQPKRAGPANIRDTAAGHAVAAAAGAHVHDWQGKPLDYTPRESFLNPGFRVSIY